MNTHCATAALAGLLLAGTIAEASAWTRQATVTTARGTYTVNSAGGCAGGTCSGTRTVTGPYGGTVIRGGSITQTAPGQYQYSGAVTGPYGRTVTRSGTITKTAPGQYQYSGTTTGPYGGTVTRQGTVVVNPPRY